jgi:hypothetical protein
MTICLDEPCVDDPVTRADETYWTANNAAPPVLLIDEATQAITEAVHRIRSDPLLHYHDLAAAGVALGDLFGGLDQLTDLLIHPVSQCVDTDLGGVRRLEGELESLRATLRLAQQATEGLRQTAPEVFRISDTGRSTW